MKDNSAKTLIHFWKSLIKYKGLVVLVMMSIVLASALDSVIPVFFKNFFNVLTSGDNKEIVVKGLFSALLLIMLLKLSRWVFWRITIFILNFLESRVITDLYEICFSYLQHHSFLYFSNNFSGSMVKKTKSYVNAFEVLADQIFFELLPGIVTITIMTTILSKINIALGMGMLSWIILFLGINWIFTKYKIKFDIKRSETETEASGFLSDAIANNTNIKLFNGYKIEEKGFSIISEKLHKIRRFTWDLNATFGGIQSFLLMFLEVGIFYLAINLWKRNVLTVGDFVLIQSYIIVVINMVWDFGRIITKIYERLAEAEEMTIILNTPHEIVDVKGAKKLKIKEGRIIFEKVSFAYEKDENIIDNFNLEIKPKETVALVGTSGSGKTTLTKLILRLFDIKKGRILIDNQDISKVSQESLRANVSLVPQDPILFHRSLIDNIRYGKPNATDKEVIRAAKMAHCDKFISRLSLGYNTFVGERGVKLSGGERQRVAIARAILRNAPILVLDEATSSLDSESEKYIQDSLEKLMKNKTVIIIAHRLSTIKKADRIIVIDGKKIVEEGSHSKLINLEKGIYNRLWKIQVGGFIE